MAKKSKLADAILAKKFKLGYGRLRRAQALIALFRRRPAKLGEKVGQAPWKPAATTMSGQSWNKHR
jgi:hypothetical protein